MVRPALWPGTAVIRIRPAASLLPRLRRQAPIASKRSPPQRWLVTGPRCLLSLGRQRRQASPTRRQCLPRQLTSGSELTGRWTSPSGQLGPSLAILTRRRTHGHSPSRNSPRSLHPAGATMMTPRPEPNMSSKSAKPSSGTSRVPVDRNRATATGAHRRALGPRARRTLVAARTRNSPAASRQAEAQRRTLNPPSEDYVIAGRCCWRRRDAGTGGHRRNT